MSGDCAKPEWITLDAAINLLAVDGSVASFVGARMILARIQDTADVRAEGKNTCFRREAVERIAEEVKAGAVANALGGGEVLVLFSRWVIGPGDLVFKDAYGLLLPATFSKAALFAHDRCGAMTARTQGFGRAVSDEGKGWYKVQPCDPFLEDK